MGDEDRFGGTYSLDEMCRHFAEHEQYLQLPENRGHDRNVLTQRWIALASQNHFGGPNQREYKTARFVAIYDYLSSHMKEFDVKDYAVYGSDAVGALFSKRLLKAIHELFTTTEQGHQPGFNPAPVEVMALSDSYVDSDMET